MGMEDLLGLMIHIMMVSTKMIRKAAKGNFMIKTTSSFERGCGNTAK